MLLYASNTFLRIRADPRVATFRLLLNAGADTDIADERGFINALHILADIDWLASGPWNSPWNHEGEANIQDMLNRACVE